jgi:hypothetical protein
MEPDEVQVMLHLTHTWERTQIIGLQHDVLDSLIASDLHM